MHLDAATHPGRKINLNLSPLNLSERERSSLLGGPTLRVDVEIEHMDGERSMHTVGTFSRSMLSQFSSLIAMFVAKRPFATDIAFISDVNPTALAYLFDWMMEICTKEKISPLTMTMDLDNDIDIYFAAVSLRIEEAASVAANALIFFIDSCAWDLDAFASMVNRLPVKSRVMDHLLLVTLCLCHEDKLEGFDNIRAILKPLPLVRKRMRELDESIEDPVEDEMSELNEQSEVSFEEDDEMDDLVEDLAEEQDGMEVDYKPMPGPKMGFFRPQSRKPGTFCFNRPLHW